MSAWVWARIALVLVVPAVCGLYLIVRQPQTTGGVQRYPRALAFALACAILAFVGLGVVALVQSGSGGPSAQGWSAFVVALALGAVSSILLYYFSHYFVVVAPGEIAIHDPFRGTRIITHANLVAVLAQASNYASAVAVVYREGGGERSVRLDVMHFDFSLFFGTGEKVPVQVADYQDRWVSY